MQSNFNSASNTAQDKAHEAQKEGKGLLGNVQDKASSFLGTTQDKAEEAKGTAEVSSAHMCYIDDVKEDHAVLHVYIMTACVDPCIAWQACMPCPDTPLCHMPLLHANFQMCYHTEHGK